MRVVLTGLDGANPLGFMAALGVVVVLDDRGVAARLSWQEEGAWRPVIHGVGSLDELIDHVMADLATWRDEPALDLRYTDRRGACDERDLKPPPEIFAAFAAAMRAQGARSAEMVAAFATDVAVDNNGATKPTALHFTAGQQRFLVMVRELREQLQREQVREALDGPWRYQSVLPVLGWDATTARSYALRASDPSKVKKAGVPGADWLALVGLRLWPVVPRGARAVTTGVTGGWKTGRLTWPLWKVPLPRMVVASLLQQAVSLSGQAPSALDAWGVGAILQSSILRSDQGGYGSMSPARVVR